MRKIGDTIYLCRTCHREYNSSMELCDDCYAVDLQKHQGHEYAQLKIERVTDMPDDLLAQVNNWWRCSFPGCNLGGCFSSISVGLAISLNSSVTGPSIEFQHKHPEARLCLGDALIDSCRQSTGLGCIKTFSYRNRLTEPANPTNMKCNVCVKRERCVPLPTSL